LELKPVAKTLLAADEAQRVGLRFIRGIYYRGKITINQTKLVTEGTFPVYHLEGSIKVPSRNPLGRLTSPESPYTFRMQVHALEGSILGYEVT
jgi:hypothetical protein